MRCRPVGRSIAAVMPTRRSLRSARCTSSSANTEVHDGADGDLERLAGLGVDLPDRVELVGRVETRGLVAAALLGDRVHDHGRAVVLRLAKCPLHGVLVVAVDRADVLDVEVRVERLVVGEPAEEPVQAAANAAVERTRGPAESIERSTARQVQVAVALLGAHRVQEARHAADGGRVRAAVVVDDDDELAGVVVGDVVQRLPRHAARERAVADDRDDVAIVLAGHLEGARDAVGPESELEACELSTMSCSDSERCG